ncbi:PREDICTED: UDP-glycosyltransferase 73C7-like isoform X2 [Camelina sativa]|uniref:Glycosyltransferase n=1 Tax=Camelina sativa TaxID=90675 RepID=A0ABM0YPN6_CAMSA|nr:PREDICTED: UDP-glycosyltransferase 73C7-like isoform X1 [Camelina sativa]XP_019100305.1 PREDICTED: UDP-glycosyltransferase 73C7-like isoform X2 [Camelina sativa]
MCSHDALHFVVIPFMAQGHMIPLVDISRLLSQRQGVTVSIITTTQNVAKIKTSLSSSFPTINIVEVKFPSQQTGLPEGCESVDMLASLVDMVKFFDAANSLEEQVEKAMVEMVERRPSCIIGDMSLPFTSRLAKKFKIPKLLFHGFSCFSLMCIQVVRESGILKDIESNDEYFDLPGLPDRVEFTKPQVSVLQLIEGNMKESTAKIIEADNDSYGVIVNSFEELEVEYAREYRKARAGKVWCVGPVSLCNKLGSEKAERGDKASIGQDQCLQFLDSKEAGSVLYVCLGSLCNLPLAQLKDLGLGLEESKKPFIWVIREWGKYGDLAKWMQQSGFEERIKGRGLVIKGWAPQVFILSHASIGGFLTHCGWNSTLEGITAGVPLLTWPLSAEQFLNEKLIVQILKSGLKIGVEKMMKYGKEEEIGVMVSRENVRKAVDELMGDSEEAEERRRKVKELSDLANKALGEGGSSDANLTLLIQDIMEQTKQHQI